jgi:iron(III) transport system substrate-binding protein
VTSAGSTTGSAEWSALQDAANTEGHVNVTTVLSPASLSKLKDAFSAAYPKTDVTYTQLAPTALITRIDGEQGSKVKNTEDVIIETDRQWHTTGASKGYFSKIVGPDVLAADQKLRGGTAPITSGPAVPTQLLYDGDTKATMSYGLYGYVWKSSVQGTPSFDSLFNGNTYKGKIATIPAEVDTTHKVLYAALADRYPNMWQQLGKLSPTYYSLGPALAQGVAAGAVDVGFPSSAAVAASSTNLGYANISPPIGGGTYTSVLASAAHPNAAQLFVDFELSAQGQAAIAAGSWTPVISGISSSVSPKDLELIDILDTPQVDAAVAKINMALGR